MLQIIHSLSILFLLTFAAVCQAENVPLTAVYELPKHPSWTKGLSGKRKLQHNYDYGAFKNGVLKGRQSLHGKPAVDMAVSSDGKYGEASLKYFPFSRCEWSRDTESCVLTVEKRKTKQSFKFHSNNGTGIMIDDMLKFVAFVDGPDRFSIRYLKSNGKTVTVDF